MQARDGLQHWMVETDVTFVAWNQKRHVEWMMLMIRHGGRRRLPTCAILPQPVDFVKRWRDDWIVQLCARNLREGLAIVNIDAKSQRHRDAQRQDNKEDMSRRLMRHTDG